MSRVRIWLGLLISSVAAIVASQPATAQQPRKPNIVFMLVDNLAYGELGVYGGGILRGAATPRIDALAGQIADGGLDLDPGTDRERAAAALDGLAGMDAEGIGFGWIGEQTVALAQGRFEPRRIARMIGGQRHDHPVEKPPPRACAFGEQPVHRRGQPADGQPFRQRIGRGLSAVNLHHTARWEWLPFDVRGTADSAG